MITIRRQMLSDHFPKPREKHVFPGIWKFGEFPKPEENDVSNIFRGI